MNSKPEDLSLGDALQRPVYRRRLEPPHIARLLERQS